MRRKIYLKRKDLDDAMKEFFKSLEEAGFFDDEEETIETQQACGRVTSRAVYAKRNVPHYTSSAMDGIAVRSFDTFGASEVSPIVLEEGKDFVYVNTGDPIPDGFDAVIMVEKIRNLENGKVMIFEPVHPLKNLRIVGEDVAAGEMILTRYHLLKSHDIALLLAAGVYEVPVLKKLRAEVIPTGDEVKPPETARKSGEIPETNGPMTVSFLKNLGVETRLHDIVKDDPSLLKDAIGEALERSDIVLTIAGSSAGSKDYTYRVLEEMGNVVAHGVNVRPGKPVVMTVIEGKPVIGLPGFPVSLHVILEEVVKPLIMTKYKIVEQYPMGVHAVCSTRISSSISEDEYVRGVVAKVGGKTVFSPLKRGSANLTSLTRHNAVLKIEKGKVLVEEGEEVEVLWRGGCLECEVLVIGSHDLLMDVLADLLKKEDYRLNLRSSNVGSLGGILAVSKGYAHMAGTHLLDPESGEYNVSYIERFLKDYVLVNVSYRIQGLMVKRGNPKGIRDLKDLARKDVTFVNRQKASGTRVLLDLLLKREGIDPSNIKGYEIEEVSHVGVAMKVKSGVADVGLGIASAARMMGLDFIPLAKERYDLLVRRDFAQTKVFEKILKTLRSDEFRRTAEALGGYDLSESGKVIVG